jgi:dTDP-4-amino-4,6-dideoxygalactose transaminase
MSNLLAAVGRGQLRVLPSRVERRREIFDFYRNLLQDVDGIELMPEAPYGRSNRWLSCLTMDERRLGISNEALRLALEEENIESRPLWKPMHLQPVFRDCECIGGDVSERLFAQGLCLPSGTAMADAEFARIESVLSAQLRL